MISTKHPSPSDIDTRWVDLAGRTGYRWDRSISRYRDNENGRLVPESRILSSVERFNEQAIRGNVSNITERFLDGRIDLPRWQELMAREIKDGWVVSAYAGRGGKNAMTFADYGRLGGRLRFEYQQLNRFALRIKNGEMTAAQIRVNAELYALSARTGYWDGMTAAKRDAGYIAEQRFLGQADHCEVCVGLADRGIQPVGTLPEPGTVCEGKRRCKCTKVYYKDFEGGT
jgi:hypothetical protein